MLLVDKARKPQDFCGHLAVVVKTNGTVLVGR